MNPHPGRASLNYLESDTRRRYASHLQRALILDAQPAATRLLTELLKGLGVQTIFAEATPKAALARARHEDPQIVFTEFAGPRWEGLEFVRAFRRSDMACRQAPIVMITAEATAQSILGARDAGVHEFLRKPYTIKDLIRRIDAVTLKSRDWVEAVRYIGPDRRRFNSGDYAGPRKRKSDTRAMPDAARIDQALRILKSALQAIETDPAQALRAMQAQAVDLTKVAVSVADSRLATAAAGLQQRLREAVEAGVLDRPSLEEAARPLWSYLPSGKSEAAA
jgi:CheY-like chemotaxis protein